ncbi:MAG TPA: hypothetical protein VHB02_19030 [Acidimicrobiales bacterium]|nr:hypothetical protein [Acidimicrobiales bacterium]
MTERDPVPEADRLEQALPADPDPWGGRPHPAEVPEADAAEQDLPVGEPEEEVLPEDAERVEPDEDPPR